jgi:hypothetical protein
MLALAALLSAAELICRAELGIFFFETVAVPLLPASPFALAAVLLGLFALAMGLLQNQGLFTVERSRLSRDRSDVRGSPNNFFNFSKQKCGMGGFGAKIVSRKSFQERAFRKSASNEASTANCWLSMCFYELRCSFKVVSYEFKRADFSQKENSFI